MGRSIAAVVLALLVSWLALPVAAAERDWLVGKWELYHDPDGSPKDWLEFERDGKMTSYSAKGRSVPGEYSINDGSISIVLDFGGKAVPLRVTYSPDRKKLLYYSSRSGNTAEYRKIK